MQFAIDKHKGCAYNLNIPKERRKHIMMKLNTTAMMMEMMCMRRMCTFGVASDLLISVKGDCQ